MTKRYEAPRRGSARLRALAIVGGLEKEAESDLTEAEVQEAVRRWISGSPP